MRVAISALQTDATAPSTPKPNLRILAMDNNPLFFHRSIHYLKSYPGILMMQLQVENKVCRQVQKHSRNQKKIDSKSHARSAELCPWNKAGRKLGVSSTNKYHYLNSAFSSC